MSQSVPVNILSDDDDGEHYNAKDYIAPPTQNDAVCIDLSTPVLNFSKKKQRLSDPANSNPSSSSIDAPVFIIDDDITPRKHSLGPTATPVVAETPPPISSHFSKLEEVSLVRCSYSSFGVNSTPSIVAETPLSELSKPEVSIVKCNHGISVSQPLASLNADRLSPESRLVSLESDNESERGLEGQNPDGTAGLTVHAAKEFEFSPRFVESPFSFGGANQVFMSVTSSPSPNSLEDELSQVHGGLDVESDRLEQMDKVSESKGMGTYKAISQRSVDLIVKGRMPKEERLRLKEEKKLQKEQEKLRKAVQKAEAAELKKLQKEKQKWEKGKFALKSIVAEVDSKVVEMGSIGGHLLTRFAEKGLSYRVMSNPIERSIMWTITVPEELSQISSEGNVIPYVLLIYEAEEFCNLVMNGTLVDQISRVQHHYPSYTICYLTNRLMAYINKREQDQYKNPGKYEDWKRPPIEEVLAKLTSHFTRVHSRQCVDEAELAEHVTGLTCSLASCQYRKKLTPLSVNANGSLIPKDCADRNLIKKNLWLKALVAIPKVQPRFAIAIWKRYPTMKSLLSVYMDPSKSVHEKEFLLKDLATEGLLGDDRRLGEICSKRVYRVLMAQCGNMTTDDVENGADFFSQ